MLWVADYSFARPWPLPGYVGVVRYILGAGKGITKAEYDQLLSRGMSVTLVMETGTQPAMGGYGGGVTDARAAFAQADSIGWPSDRPIYFVAEDPNPVAAASWATVAAYFAGLHQLVPVSRIGAYGSAALVDWLIATGKATFGWAVETWPGSPAGLHLRQMYNAVPGAPSNLGGIVDPNECLQADWGQHPAPNTPPPGGSMTPFVCADPISGGTWAIEADGAVYTADGAPFCGGANQHPEWHIAPIVGLAPWTTGYVIVSDDPNDTTGDRFRYYRMAGAPDRIPAYLARLGADEAALAALQALVASLPSGGVPGDHPAVVQIEAELAAIKAAIA